MKSIIQEDNGVCFICKKRGYTEEHHCLGGANRKHSEKYGLKVYLCKGCHTLNKTAVHNDYDTMCWLRKIAQKEFEKTHTREEFMRIFGRNYDV